MGFMDILPSVPSNFRVNALHMTYTPHFDYSLISNKTRMGLTQKNQITCRRRYDEFSLKKLSLNSLVTEKPEPIQDIKKVNYLIINYTGQSRIHL